METYYAIVFNTDLGTTVAARVSKAVPDLPKAAAVAAANKMAQANCFDPKFGNLTTLKSLKCVKTTTTPIEL